MVCSCWDKGNYLWNCFRVHTYTSWASNYVVLEIQNLTYTKSSKLLHTPVAEMSTQFVESFIKKEKLPLINSLKQY